MSTRLLRRIARVAADLDAEPDARLRERSLALKYRVRAGEPAVDLIPEAFALVQEAASRTVGLRHYPAQLAGGFVLYGGGVAQMQTGEGKTLTATLPVYLHALMGRGGHIVTVNDYLAGRDRDWMGPIFEFLGLSVGLIQSSTPSEHRPRAYAADVTYVTAKELGFDFLRDRLPQPAQTTIGRVQRRPYFAVVDEIDSVLLDDARTPLMIRTPGVDAPKALTFLFRWCASQIEHFERERDFTYDAERREVSLTSAGSTLLRRLTKPAAIDAVTLTEIQTAIERALLVPLAFVRDRHYVVRGEEVVIVDEFTGRLAERRQWREGIHQAIEAREGLPISPPGEQSARITVQDLFRQYPVLAGMSGTAWPARREFRKVYGMRVKRVPTHRPSRRRQWPSRVFANQDCKWQAVVQEVHDVVSQGRPVLVGTRSIDKSERLAERLLAGGIHPSVLNALSEASEAQIIAQAGQACCVTVATNMAGRGTDIELGEGVAEAGGLHVIGTEMHESSRIDQQLFGRCGRQGDPGSYRQFVSLDDDLLALGLGEARATSLQQTPRGNGEVSAVMLRWFEEAQRRMEQRHFRQRQQLLAFESLKKSADLEMGNDYYLNLTGE